MATPHNSAEPGDYAPVCLLPGDPLRARYIAQNFLDDARQVNAVRNCLGFTGTYKGVPVSVQASGMGIPSLSIYVNELARVYGVKRIIRPGSAGGVGKGVHIRDIVLAQGSSTDSNVAAGALGPQIHYAPLASFSLLDKAYHIAAKQGLSVKVGDVFAADRFYNDEIDNALLAEYGVLAVEMESAGLYMLGARLGFEALSILSVSDMILGEGEALTAEERASSLDDMIVLSLETAIAN
ncbi:purine-nucleoside phosphorylase [Atopobiaceae bacterium 24-176]